MILFRPWVQGNAEKFRGFIQGKGPALGPFRGAEHSSATALSPPGEEVTRGPAQQVRVQPIPAQEPFTGFALNTGYSFRSPGERCLRF
jgi:hypothetical protein